MSDILNAAGSKTEPRIWAQHQAILTLVLQRLTDKQCNEFVWLDLGCGQGQIISQLEHNIPSEVHRAKIEYIGYDINPQSTKVAETQAVTLKLKAVAFHNGHLRKFNAVVEEPQNFDLITLTNTAHELSGSALPALFYDAVLRLKPNGLLYAYDMETLPQNELGAVTWSGTEVAEICLALFQPAGLDQQSLAAQRWRHSSVMGWSITLRRDQLNGDLQGHRGTSVAGAIPIVNRLVEKKLAACKLSLEALTTGKATVGDDDLTLNRLLFDLWALTRAAENSK